MGDVDRTSLIADAVVGPEVLGVECEWKDTDPIRETAKAGGDPRYVLLKKEALVSGCAS
jgi:hypothetical protein